MPGPRLIRMGTVREVSGGCTSIEVSVPCTTCRLGCAGARSGLPQIELGAECATLGLDIGESVRLSVSAAGVTRSSLLLFGPVLVWALAVALLPGGGTPGHAIAVAAGLAAGLLLGHRLVRGRGQDANALLGVRAERPAVE